LKLTLIAVGHRMPAWVNAGFEEYARRMPRGSPLRLTEVKPEPRGEAKAHASTVSRLTAAEGERIAAAYPKRCIKVVLDERGRTSTTRELAVRIGAWQTEGRDIAFVIGGADGLAPTVKRDADFMWSLSPLTLPHGLVRVIVAEQLYRAFSIVRNHPYHRGDS
jgi:23S rRNA (pseudouridine1915-N3)-methyltransferase